MKKFLLVCLIGLGVLGCSSHTPDPNVQMMDKTMGELDRETAK